MLSAFIRDQQGATVIEYVLIAAIVALAIIAGAQVLGQNLSERFTTIAETMAA